MRIPKHHEITRVEFYKRDEITTDLICCDVSAGDHVYFFHEEMPGWDAVIAYLEQLPGFRLDWFAAVSQPTFAESLTLAYEQTGSNTGA